MINGKEKLKIEKMRYVNNKLSYSFTLLAMCIYVLLVFWAINPFRYNYLNKDATDVLYPDLWVGLKILLSILVILLSFLTAEKVKAYDKKASYRDFVFAAIVIIEIFIFPLNLFRYEAITLTRFITIILLSLISGALYTVAGIVNIRKVNELAEVYKDEIKELEHHE